MTLEQASAFLGRVELLSGRSFQSSSRKYLEQQLLKEPHEIAIDVIGRIEYEAGPLPTPIGFMKMVMDYASKHREYLAKQERKKYKVVDILPKNNQLDSEHAQNACNLARAVLSGLGREKVIEGMMHLQKSNPNAGWATASHHLQEFYQQVDKREVIDYRFKH